MTKILVIAAAASAFLAAAAHAQKKNAPAASTPVQSGDSVFSSDSNLVLVDSIVTDKTGAYIVDLTQKNFKVREDGKQQAITSFSQPGDGAPDNQKHYLVLLFDNPTVPLDDQHYARDTATKFIGLNAGPNRLMAVVEFDQTLRVTQNLTDDVDKLKLAVNQAKPLVAPSGTPTGTTGGIGAALSGTNIMAKAVPGGLPEALSNLARGMVKLPGRKTVILFSEDLTTRPDLLKKAIAECNRANVGIYPADIGALVRKGVAKLEYGASLGRTLGAPPQNPAASHAVALDDLNKLDDLSGQSAPDLFSGLARGTGGFVVPSAAKLPDDLSMIAKEESQYYILGYLPPKEPQPGSCHAIKVETDRSGANVRARNSYCDGVTPEIQAGTPTERDLEARLNANATPTIHATMQTPFFYVAPNTARVDLALDIPGAGVKFAKDKGRFTATLNVIGIAYLPDNGVAARFNDTRKVTLDDQQQVDDFASRPYHFEKQFEMASGKFDVKVAFSSSAADFGEVETPLTIDAWDPSKFLLSGLALSQSTHPATAPGLGGEVDLFGDKVPLAANGVQFIPAGTNRLQKSQKAFIYGEIYEPALAAPDRKDDPGLGAQLTLIDDKTGQIAKYMGFTGLKPETVPGTSAVPFGMILPTDELPPGSYTAQITVLDAAANHTVRRIDFELAP